MQRKVVVSLNRRERAAVLAGLRLVQAELPRGVFLPHGVSEIFDDGGEIEPLTVHEIDEICVAIRGA